MGTEAKMAELVKIKAGSRAGDIAVLVNDNCSTLRPIVEVRFSDGGWSFFEEDEVENFEGLICPNCLAAEGLFAELSEPYQTDNGLMTRCPNGHELHYDNFPRQQSEE